jgi:hypothetical protein
LHAEIAPTRASASRILLTMRSTPRMCPGRGELRLDRRCRSTDRTESAIKDPSAAGSHFGCSRLAVGGLNGPIDARSGAPTQRFPSVR